MRKSLLLVAVLVAVALAGCMSYVGPKDPILKFGDAANTAAEAVHDAEAAGRIPPDSGGGELLSTLLYIGLGLLGVGGGAVGVRKIASTVANRKVAEFDAAPDTVAFQPDGTTKPV